MKPRHALSLFLLGGLLASASAAAAQPGRTIAAGQSLSGRLADADPTLRDGSHFHDYVYRGRAGDRLRITLRSSEFDTYLAWGPRSGAAFTSEANDDDGGGGTDSQLRVTVGSGGTYVIRVNSLEAGKTGAYSLEVARDAEGGSQGANAAGRAVEAGQTVSGRLAASDAKLNDGSHFHDYQYRGSPGDRLRITLRSSEFDTYLAWGARSGAAFTSEATDDDGGGGTDSQLRVTVGSGGTYVVRVNSLEAGKTGAYSLEVARDAEGGGGGRSIAAGQTTTGRLAASDPKLQDGSHFHDYEFRGRAGERLVVTLRSSDFDTYLAWGPRRGATFTSEATDDDGAGGTNSQLRVTVGSGGTYVVRVNSLEGGKTGSYSLAVQADGGQGGGGTVAGGSIRAGEPVNGRLETSDRMLTDSSYFDTYVYRGTPGEQILVTLSSTDFDAYLRGGRGQGAQFTLVDQDDDGAGGTNSRIQTTLDASGSYTIQANALRARATGAYSLVVERAEGSASSGARSVALGRPAAARFTAQDPVLSDNSHFHLYEYRGRPGERVLVTLRSTDFDAYLSGGRITGGRFQAEQNDDDSGGGTNAQMVATLPGSGVYAIQANTLRAGDVGAYTLTVEPVSGAVAERPSAPAGAASIAAGQTRTGTLAAGDRMLSDSSFFDEYVFQGQPGQRLRITLRSPQFDAFLRWGRLNGGQFQDEAHDDDGAGGTDAQVTVTVGGTGTYAIQANAFEAGKTGSYTLTVEPLAPETAAEAGAAERSSSSAGKWLYAYVEPTAPVFRPVGQRIKQGRMLENLTEGLNARFPLPRNVAIRTHQCGQVNAFYSPSQGMVTFCYELFQDLVQRFVPDGQWTPEQREAVDGASTFILMHEVGHALVHVLDLPITGREEDAVDQLAAVMLISSGEKGALAALNGVQAVQPGAGAVFDNSDFADEHSLGPQRLFNVACWIYGSDPRKYSRIVSGGMLPPARAQRCPGEYERLSKAWMRLLQAAPAPAAAPAP